LRETLSLPLARAELLQRLIEHGIVRRSPTRPVRSRDGRSAPWTLDSLAVTLSPRGAELAGQCVLDALQRFEGRQLATYGLTGVPILQSCILQSQGHYRGLLVRKQPKRHGARNLIEGPIDPAEPVILVDDSINSGTSMLEACARLERAGLRVEGGVCLVRFGWYGGYALMQGSGYHVEAVFDAWNDLVPLLEGEPPPDLNPSRRLPEVKWSSRRAPERLHPAHLARLVIMEYLATGRLLRPPERLDADYDAAGGAWVSVRSRDDIHRRHARDGFWRFPDEEAWTAAESVVRASLKTASRLPRPAEGRKLLEGSRIAVTFFSALEPCSVGQLDNDRYGIVVRSRERPAQMGGALPRMPGVAGEWEQFQHARVANGRLLSFEPYVLYRHDVVKAVEPGAIWPPMGVPRPEPLPWHEDPAVGGRVAARAHDVVAARVFNRPETTSPLPDGLLPDDLEALWISIFSDGDLLGSWGSAVEKLDRDLSRLARATLGAVRARSASASRPARLAVSISLLHDRTELGTCPPREVVRHLRPGQHALMIRQGRRDALLLPFVALTRDLDRSRLVRETMRTARIVRPPHRWGLFECTAWLADDEGVRRFGEECPEGRRSPAATSLDDTLRRLAALHANYLVRHQRDDGSLFLRYEPFRNRLYYGADAPRRAHAAWVLARAHRHLGGAALEKATARIIAHCLKAECRRGQLPSAAESALLLLALCELPPGDPRRARVTDLSAPLWAGIDRHGRIAAHLRPAEGADALQDEVPGQVLLALGTARQAGLAPEQPAALAQACRYYRHLIRYKRDVRPVSWLMQAFGAWWRVRPEPQFAELVFEVGDAILEFQQETTGGFITDQQPDSPGHTTAAYLEGVGAGTTLAAALGDHERHQRYLAAYTRGVRFLERLVIHPHDAALFSEPELAVGGVRRSLHRSEVRIEYVLHALCAVLELAPPPASRSTLDRKLRSS
jgi:orotate phosphoribosyltransferase